MAGLVSCSDDMVVAAGLISLSIICYNCFSYLQYKHGMAWNWPFLGMVPSVLLHFHRIQDYITPILEKRPGNTTFLKGPWFARKDMLLTSNPANVHYTTCTKFSNFPRGSRTKKCFDVFGDGLFNAEGEEWMGHRKVLRAFFNHQRLNRVSTRMILEKAKEGLVPVLEDACKRRNIIDIQDLMQRFAYDVTYNMVAGVDPKSLCIELPNIPFSTAMNDAMDAVILRHFFPEWFWRVQSLLRIGKEGALARAKKTLEKIVTHQVSSKREELAKSHKTYDLLTTYMEEAEEFKTRANDKILEDSILSLMLAGKDTTSATLTWFFYAISQSHSSLNKIREEIERVIIKEVPPNDDRARKKGSIHVFTDPQELGKLNYLQAALCETLRLYPAVPFQVRVPTEPDILPTGHAVCPDTTIVIPLYAMGRMTSIWGKDCSEFKPERWMNDRGEVKREQAYKFFTFNAGPRICLGKEVAFMEMKVVAATILYNYDVRVLIEKDRIIAPVVSVIFRMKHGLKATLTNRWA